ncbi:MAG: tandem-95 repeat protein, partial [Roseibium sp.]|uniref:tandem-95 repeat protein n=1 Tax=Roseibium sp. TaxID=1936156 RepID=UPI002612D9FA
MQLDENGDLVLSDAEFNEIKQTRVDAGLYDPGTTGPSGRGLTSFERALARDDDAAKAFAGNLNRSVNELLVAQNEFGEFDARVRALKLNPDFIDGISKAGHSASKKIPTLLTAVSTAAILAASTKTGYAAQYEQGAENTEEATKGLISDFATFLNSIRAEDASELLLNFVIETEQKARVAITGGPEGVGLVVADFTLSLIEDFIEVFRAFRILFDKNVFLAAMEPIIEGLAEIIDDVQKRIEIAVDEFDQELGNDIPEAFVASGNMIIDRETGENDDGGAQYIIALDNAEVLAGKGNDVVIHFGSGYVRGGEGDDVLVGWTPKFVKSGELVDPDNSLSPRADRDLWLTLDGGEGDDWVVTVLGEKAVTIGGNGRDWIFNTSAGGELYGDTIDGQSPDGTDLEASENADNFWWWPDTTIMDARPNDVLKFFGFPLVGGTNNIPMLALGPAAFLTPTLGLATYQSPLFFDNFMVFMNYIFKDGDLYVVNLFDGLLSLISDESFDETGDGISIRGAMRVRDYDSVGSYWGAALAANPFETGDLGMQFKLANPYLAALAVLPPILGGLNQVLPLVDEVLALASAAARVGKIIAWGSVVDPLIFDLDGDGIETIAIEDGDVYFDIDGDFFAEKTGWLSGDDGFLTLDKNGNGRVDDITELFGGIGQSGLQDLAGYDDNGDGKIDATDAIWSELKIWQDVNQDGVSQDEELSSLDDLGILSISLAGTDVNSETPQGATLLTRGEFTWASGGIGTVYDAIFELNDIDTQYRGETGLAPWLSELAIDAKGFGRVTDLSVAMSGDFELGELVAEAAQTMTTPKLKTLREQSADVLGKWAFVQELTRELTPVLLEEVDGVQQLVDRGVYVEDAEGGYWTLASGQAVLDADGAAIDRPVLEDVLAQAASTGQTWQLEQAFSPSTRAAAPEHRDVAPYLVELVDGRALVLDYGIENEDGSWRLASGADVLDADGAVIAAPTREDVQAQATVDGQEWRVEEIGFNPYGDIDVEEIGIYLIDGIVVDYTVEVTDADGSFYVWARNLDRALELQDKYGSPRDFNLRSYEVDFETLDEVGSTDDSTYRVELLTPGQFHFATSLVGIDFQPQMLSADIDHADGTIAYSVNDSGDASLSDEAYVSGIKGMIDLLDVVMKEYTIVSRAFAVRMALQGGLGDFARGIEYDVDLDAYRPTTDRELAPMFEAILEGAPTGYDEAYAYLQDWNELLWQVYPDYRLDDTANLMGNTVAIDQAFIFQMLLGAYENVPVDVDLLAAMNALSVNEELLRTHEVTDTEVTGTTKTDFFYISEGDQTYFGGRGADVYFVGKDFGTDYIYDQDHGGTDDLRFSHVKSDDVTAVRDGQDLILSVDGTTDVLRITDQFLGELNPYLTNGTQMETGMTSIVFADGVIWDRFRMAMEVADPRDTNDVYTGSGDTDVLWGGKGNDVMRGDIYIYERGDGQDVIGEGGGVSVGPMQAGIDFLQFRGDISVDDLKLVRDGASDDLQIFLLDENGEETGDSIYIEGQFGGVRLNLEILGLIDPSLEMDFVSPNMIERFIFEDGNSLDFDQIVARVLENARTDGDDAIYGLLNDNTLDGGAGNDYLSALEGGDTYVFGEGYGHDVVEDNDYSIKIFGSAADRLRFQDDLRWTDFDYLREGPSDTLTLRIKGTEDQITLTEFLKSALFVGFINLIEEFEFADGTVWSYLKLLQHFIDTAKTVGDDTIYGFLTSDTLDGGAGNDRLEGLEGNDTYLFSRGYGQDTIFDASGSDRLVLEGIATTDVTFTRTALDLIITVNDTGDQVVLENQYVRADQQGNAVEYLEFSDRTLLFSDLNPEDLDLVGSSADETITGSNFAEVLDGRAGDDTLIGGDGGDLYKFDVGYGSDIIVDTRLRASWNDRKGVSVPVDDTVEFGDDITRDNVVFTKDGNDLVITVTGRTDTLRIRNQFLDIANGVERFTFQNGDLLLISDVEELLQIEGGNHGDNIIEGVQDQPNTLDGRQGDDTLIGGTAADTYAFGADYDFDRIEEKEDEDGVIDRVIFGSTVTQDALIVRRDGDDLQIDLGNRTDVLTIVNGLTTTKVEEFHFADGTVLSLDDLLDRLLIGTDGDDQLLGFDDRDDVLAGGAGSDAMSGGTGNDTYKFGFGDGSDSVEETGGTDVIEFGTGVTRDQVAFADVDGDLLIILRETGERLVVLGGGVNAASAARVESFVFADGETLTYSEVMSILRAQAVNTGQDDIDTTDLDKTFDVLPGTGFDTVKMSVDAKIVFNLGDNIDRIELPEVPGEGEITFSGLYSTDAVVRVPDLDGEDLLITFPESGDQVLLAGAQLRSQLPLITFGDGVSWTRSDLIARSISDQAGDEADVVFGSSGADTIEGGKGDDDIKGGAGADTYLFTRGDGRDVIEDESGTDVLKIFGYAPDELQIIRPVAGRNELLLTFAGSDDEIYLRYDNTLNGVDSIVFSDGTTLTRDELFASTVGKGTDFNDEITGTTGNDTIEGGRGNDLLEGGSGVDTYVFRRGDGRDVIDESGSSSNLNKLVLLDHVPADISALPVEGSSYDVVLRLGNGDEIVLENALSSSARVRLIEFSNGVIWTTDEIREASERGTVPTGVHLLTGTDGNDTLVGTAAEDIFDGKDGSDLYIYARGGGRDLVRSQPEFDTVNTLEIRGYNKADARFEIAPESLHDLVIRFPDSGDQIYVEDAFYDSRYSSSGGVSTYWRTVQTFLFDDGPMQYEDVIAYLTAQQVSDGDDIVFGTTDNDVIEAGTGNDVIDTRDDYDTIVFRRGDGQDTILISDYSDDDTLELYGYIPDDVSVGRISGMDGYVLTFAGTDDRIEVRGNYDDDDGAIDEIVFDGGTTWSRSYIAGLIPTAASGVPTTGNDVLPNLDASSPFNGLTGDDFVTVYDDLTITYSAGDGQDTIGESDYYAYTLQLTDLNPSDVRLLVSPFLRTEYSRYRDYYLEIDGTTDGIWLFNGENTLSEVSFADGTVWGAAEILAAIEEFPQSTETGGRIQVTGSNSTYTSTEADEYYIQQSAGGEGGDTTYVYALGGGHDTIDEVETAYDESEDVIVLSDIASTSFEVRYVPSLYPFLSGDLVLTFGNASDSVRIVGGYNPMPGEYEVETGIDRVTFSDNVSLTMDDLSTAAQATEAAHPRYHSGTFAFDRANQSGEYYLELSPGPEQPITLADVLPSEVTMIEQNGTVVLVIAPREPDGSDGATIWLGEREDLPYFTVGLDADGSIGGDIIQAMIDTGEPAPDESQSREHYGVVTLTRGTDSGPFTLMSDYTEVTDPDTGQVTWVETPAELTLDDVLASEITAESSDYGVTLFIAARQPDGSDAMTVWIDTYHSDTVFIARLGDGTVLNINDLIVPVEPVEIVGTDGDDHLSYLLENSGGTSEELVSFEGGLGNDVINSASLASVVVYSRGDGNDLIKLAGSYDGGAQTVELKNILPEDVTFLAHGKDILLRVAESAPGAGDNGILRFLNANTGVEPEGEGGENYALQIGEIQFDNGTVWDSSALKALIGAQFGTDGDDRVTQTFGAERLMLGLGDDQAVTYDTNMTYVYRNGDGHDVYSDEGDTETYDRDQDIFIPGEDVVELVGLEPSDLEFSRLGEDFVITIKADADRGIQEGSITVVEAFAYSGNRSRNVETLRFDDGTELSVETIVADLVAGQATDGDDVITGTHQVDVLSGGAGDDILIGQRGGDTYLWARGDGNDEIGDFERETSSNDADTLQLTGVLPGNVTYQKTSRGLLVRISDSVDGAGDGGTLLLIGQFTQDADEGEGIEQIVFGDGSHKTLAEISNELLASAATIFDDRLVGTAADETLEGGLGDDVLLGGEGDDRYVYTRGDGNDRIYDEEYRGHSYLELHGIDPADVVLQGGFEDDLEIIIAESASGAGDEGRITVRRGADSYGRYGVEKIVFDDGTEWLRDDFNTLIEGNQATQGNDLLDGTSGDDVLAGLGGNDLLRGGDGNDIYRYTRGDGADTIQDGGRDAADSLEITGYAESELTFDRRGYDGLDLVIRLADTGDEITILNGLDQGSDDQIESIVLTDDGTSFTLKDIRTQLLENVATDGDDIIVGTDGDDILSGGSGNDILAGGDGDDTYLYAAGDGDDRISDAGVGADDNILRLTDYTVDDVAFAVRAGPESLDLVLRLSGERDRLVLEDALASNSDRGVDEIHFADGTVWTRDDMRARALDDIDTAGNDNVYGFDTDDAFTSQSGDDFLSGGGGSDSYVFARGSGNDTIEDASNGNGETDTVTFLNFVSSEVSVERLFKGSETIVFRFATSDEDTLTVVDALADDGRGIETYTFSDNVSWTRETIETLLDNNVPVAVDDGYFTATSGESVTILAATLLRNDFDADLDDLSIIAVDGGDNGVAELNADGNIVFTAAADFNGPTRFSYKISDGRNGIAEAYVDLRVRPVAEARNDEGFTVEEDSSLTIRTERLLSNDADGDRMIVSQVFGAENGSVSLSSNGEILFTPDENFNGMTSFTYVANTPEGGRAEAEVLIEVTAVNDAPTVVDDTVEGTLEDVAFQIESRTLLANDFDIDGDTLTLQSVASNGTVVVELTDDGYILVTPRAYFFGDAYFDYTVADASGAMATGRVNFHVEAVNNDPEPHDDLFDTYQGGPILEDNPVVINIADLLANDIERDGDTLTVTEIKNVIGGSATLLDNGTVLFEPSSNFNGDAGFDYVVDDGQGGVAEARATIQYDPVNDRPVARNDHYSSNSLAFLSGLEDTPIEIPISELLKNDYDIEGLTLTFESFNDAINGDVVLTDHGTLIFTPDQDFWGEATFSYLVSDPEGAVDDAEVTLWFENVGDAPPDAQNDVIQVYEDVPYVIPISVLLGNDTDIDRDPIEFVSWRGLTFAEEFLLGSLNGTITYTDEGDLLFTPDLNADESSGFFYTVTDNRDGSTEAFVDIQIIPVNDEPTAVNDEGYVTPLDVPLVLRVSELMANDFDVDDEPVAFAGVASVSSGTFEIVETSGETFIVVRFDEGFSGDVTVEYLIEDAEGVTDSGYVSATVDSSYFGVLEGTDAVDWLEGTNLTETIRGLDSADVIKALGGNDTIEAGAGDDDIDAGAGNDWIDGGDGADTITGGEGFDTVDFAGSNTGVRADLGSRVGQGGFAQGDTYVGIEAFAGTEYIDRLYGDDAANTLDGRGGNDLLDGRAGSDVLIGAAGDDLLTGGAGADTLDGGEDNDTADYSTSTQAVSVSLTAGTASGGDAEGDTLISIENLIGSDLADTLEGDDGANILSGGRGDDILVGGGGNDTLIGGRGADSLTGGEGIDIADYTLSDSGVTIDMANGAAGGGDALGDTFSSIEIVQGSYHDDDISGDETDNIIRGGRGADVIDGRGGFDTADYSRADEGVSVNLALGQGLAGEALGDTLTGIEKLVGSDYADTFVGSDGDDTFDGGFADDNLTGGLGSDSYIFGFDSGNDTVTEIGDVADVDRVILGSAIAPKDISLVRQGDSLLIELEHDDGLLIDTMLITDHFLGRETGIEEIEFEDGTVWNRDTIDDLQRIGRFNAVDDVYLLGVEDEIVLIDPATLIANDAEEGIEQLQIVSVQNAVNGTVELRPDGTIAFLGAQDFNGDAFFEYTVRDEFGRESTAEVEVNLSPVNDAPTGADDGVFQGQEDTILRIPFSVLLDNDFDIDGDTLTIVDVGPLYDENGDPLYSSGFWPATNGRADVVNGYVEFEPLTDYFGFAGFTYTLADPDGATSTASVELYINPVNDAPRSGSDGRTIRMDTTTVLTVDSLLANDYDLEGDAFTFQGIHSPVNGTVVLDEATGEISFTPDALGEASFSYDLIDERGAASTIVVTLDVIPLNDPPTARDDGGFETLEDTVLVIDPADLLANDTDPNGDVLTITGLQRFPLNGAVAVTDDGMIAFTPRSDYNGEAGFTYLISDGRGGFDEAFVSITVLPDNDAAILNDDIVSALEDLPIYVLAAEAFGNDVEPDGDVLFFESVSVLGVLETDFLTGPSDVAAKLSDGQNLPAWLSFDAATLTFSGNMPMDLTEPVEVVLTFSHAESGTEIQRGVTFSVADADALADGVSLLDTYGSFTERAPFAEGHEFTVDNIDTDTAVTATLTDGSALPGWLVFDAATLTFTGTPPVDATDPVEVKLTFAYTDPDDATVSMFEDSLVVDPTDTDALDTGVAYDSGIALFDLNGGGFSAELASGRALPAWLDFDAETMTLTKTAIPPADGEDPARVRIVYSPDAQPLPDGTYASSEGGFALEFVIDPVAPIDPAINALLANQDYFAAQGLFALDLGRATTVTAARENLNDLPDWLEFDVGDLSFDGLPPAEYIGALPVRIDVGGDGDVLPDMSIVTDLIVDKTFKVTNLDGIDASSGSERIDITTPEDFNGALAITYHATDEKGAVSEEPGIIVINVLPMPEIPDPEADVLEAVEDETLTFALADLLANDRDDDGDPFRAIEIGEPAHGSLTVNLSTVKIDPPADMGAPDGATYSATLADGSELPAWVSVDAATGRLTATVPLNIAATLVFLITATNGTDTVSAEVSQDLDGNDGVTLTYEPDPAYSGEDGFTYTITDDLQGAATGNVTINVAPVNDPPVAVLDVIDGLEDTPLVIDPATLLANDYDVDGDALNLVDVINAVNGTVTFENGQILFTPDANFDGLAGFDYVVSDGTDGTATGHVNVNVVSTNQRPVAALDQFDATEDTPLT